MAYIDVLSKKIYYEIYGEENEDVIVYFHGGPGASCSDYVNQAKALGRKMKIIIFDQLGVLRSDEILDNEEYGMYVQIKMIENMRRKLNINKWSVLGHSYGGALAVLYSFVHPESTEKIILECPCLNFSHSAKSIALYFENYVSKLNNRQATDICMRIKENEYSDSKSEVFDVLTLLDYIKDKKLRNYLNNISYEKYVQNININTDEIKASGERHLMKLINEKKMTENFLPLLKTVNKPLLLLCGKYDPVCSKNQIDYILDNVIHSELVMFEKSGHFPRIEEAEKYTKAVMDFYT